MTHAISLLCGALFGAGLAVSGMHDPARITAFLDLRRLFADGPAWDGTLALVLVSAVGIMLIAEYVRQQTLAPVAAPQYYTATRTEIDAQLIWGSVIFGVGWGIVGLCPGPVIAAYAVSLTDGDWTTARNILIFFAAMMVGMFAARPVLEAPEPSQSGPAA